MHPSYSQDIAVLKYSSPRTVSKIVTVLVVVYESSCRFGVSSLYELAGPSSDSTSPHHLAPSNGYTRKSEGSSLVFKVQLEGEMVQASLDWS